MRLLICMPLLLAACGVVDDSDTGAALRLAGYLDNAALTEVSGIARSQRDPNVLWLLEDDGPAVIYAFDLEGNETARVEVGNARNRDWEDIASFTRDGIAYLAIADIGDNDRERDVVTIYVIEEPRRGDHAAEIAWRVDFQYPDGPRDAESLAADAANGDFYVLSKRDTPAELFRLPLKPQPAEPLVATRLGRITSLPQPERQDIRGAEKSGWAWQPTAMDFSADGRSALVLTYHGVYFYSRTGDQSWFDALTGAPLELRLGQYRNAEAIAFDASGLSAFATVEKERAPLLHINLLSARPDAGITLMTFNVENLFDNDDDPARDDKAYLPIALKQNAAHIAECNAIEVASWRNDCLLLDWSEAAVRHKLGALAATIRQVDDGRGADVIALQEIENVRILERLRDEYLAGLGYGPAILIEGDDTRGIDVAFLSRLPLLDTPVLHPLVLDDFAERARDTRGILQASFMLPDGSALTGFAVHFPAPYHPTPMRIAAYEHLNRLRRELPDDHTVFAAGDFNTTSSEDRREKLLARFVRPYWVVAHDQCGACPGTHYYAPDESWSFLDMILVASGRGRKTTWGIRADSVQIANRTAAQVQPPGIPRRYDATARQGVSDHWPLLVAIEPTEKQ